MNYLCHYFIMAVSADHRDFVYEDLGVCTRSDADNACRRAWAGEHECLSMWVEEKI